MWINHRTNQGIPDPETEGQGEMMIEQGYVPASFSPRQFGLRMANQVGSWVFWEQGRQYTAYCTGHVKLSGFLCSAGILHGIHLFNADMICIECEHIWEEGDKRADLTPWDWEVGE